MTMKNKLISLITAAVVISMGMMFQSCCAKKVPGQSDIENGVAFNDSAIPLKPILLAVKEQYDKALPSLNKSIQLTEVDAIFDVENTNALDGNISIWVIKADYKHTTAGETTLTYSLLDTTKNAANAMVQISLAKNDALARLIVNTANDFVKNQNLIIASLKPQTFEIDINYVVDSDGTIDISPKIGNLGLDGSYERDHKVTQTIQLKFKLKS